MSTVTRSLGESEHIFAKRHLKLTTVAEITLTSFDASHVPFFTHSQYLEELVSTRTWISGGNSFDINLNLCFDGVSVGDGTISDYNERLGLVLQNAEIWSQLSLMPSLRIPQASKNGRTSSIELSLTLIPSPSVNFAETQTSSPRTPPHIKPPAGVPSAVVENINVRLQISQCPTVKTSSLKRKRGEDWNRNKSVVGVGSGTGHNDESENDYTYSSIDFASQTPGTQEQPDRINLQRDEIEDDATNDAPLSSVFSNPIKPQGSASSQACLTMLTKGMDRFAAGPPRLITFAELVKLVDCSLRGMIFTPKVAMSAGHLLASTIKDPKLGQISPAIFSPGYLQAVSQRRHLLSILARTFAGIDRHTRSVSLQQKIQRLRSIPLDLYLTGLASTSPSVGSNGPSLSDAAEARLWFLLQRNLHDRDACNKLKALRIPQDGTVDVADSGSMLDIETSQVEENDIEASRLGQEAEVSITSSDPMTQTWNVSAGPQDLEDNLLDDEPDLLQAYFDGLGGPGNRTFLEHHESEDISFRSLEDEGCGFPCGYQDDEDLFWNDLDDNEELLDETHTPVILSPDTQDAGTSDELLDDSRYEMSSNEGQFGDLEGHWTNGGDISSTIMTDDKLLDDIRIEIFPRDDQFGDLEDPWPSGADILFDEDSQSDCVQEPEMLL